MHILTITILSLLHSVELRFHTRQGSASSIHLSIQILRSFSQVLKSPLVTKKNLSQFVPWLLVKSIFKSIQKELYISVSVWLNFQKLFYMLLLPDVWSVTIRNISCQDIIKEVTANYIREKMWSASEDMLLRFQATSSGTLLRKEYESRKSFLYEQVEHVAKIQVCDSPTTSYSKLSYLLKMFYSIRGQSTTSILLKQNCLQIFFLIGVPESVSLSPHDGKDIEWFLTSGLLESFQGNADSHRSACHKPSRARGTPQTRVKPCFSKKLDLLMSPTFWLKCFMNWILVVSGCLVVSGRIEELMK